MPDPAPQIAKEWQQFGACLLLHMLLPLSPVLIEQLISGSVSPTTLYLAIAVYVLAIGTSSRNILLFVICIIVGISFSALFGMAIGSRDIPMRYLWAHTALWSVFFIHALERYNRHVVEAKPYLEFG